MVYNSPLGKTKFPLAPISDGCTFISGYAFKSKDFTGIGHPVIKIKNIQDGFVILEDSQCVDSKTVEGLNKFKLNNGDILIAMTGQGSVGRVGRLTFDGNKTPYLNQRVGKFIADEKKLNISYLYYILTTQQYQNILFNNASGSGQPNLSPAVIQSTLIPYPEYHLQCEIAKILDTINNRIIKSYAINITLEQMSQTLFKSWFVDFDPVIDNALDAGNPIPEALQTRAKLRQKVRNSADFKPLPAEIRSLFPSEFEETELGWVPKGWKEGTLPEIACINSTSWTNKNQPGYINYVDLSSAKDGRIYSIEKLSFNDAPSRARRILKKDDLIFGLVRPANRSFAYVHIDGLTGSTGFAVIRAQKAIYKNFIYYFVTYDKNIEELTRIADGGAYPAIKHDDICALPLIIPSINIIEKFDELTSNFREMMNNSLIQKEYLTNLRDTLLPKLISGELSLEDLPDLTTDTEAA
ncbi:restriction endonuclease subunit S [Escherichia albertii]|uniref:restriction endonuclease subunit S n=1 Tax=Escherichia albertii TaxID=208962 RepID=UPI000743DC0C|nr:restriction endonuclease subunit S [Escherichia albertii]EEW0114214.1 restriction endonuclease subunit S [Escherichia albertii]EFB7456379.1 restriction endonuclease subunit S [Escherichia albertii]EFO0969833.1 restriction endonuclease subunit S [Escherichia albertii]EFO4720060.1 restriction endonuclease subunit S [Escherichia albertii]MCE7716477.1 restriction endonuclease subunit S [Escherichia albertii]